MSETLFDVFGVNVTVTGAYAVLSVIVMILFMSLWLFGCKKRTGKDIFAGQAVNAAGFGLLPALAVLKGFQEMSTGAGAPVFEPLPEIRWVTVNGFFRPGRIETTAALGCFVILCIWLIIRKKELPDNGDLLMIVVCVWATIRLISEDFRAEPRDLFRYTSCATMAACLSVWSVRKAKKTGAHARMIADLAPEAICIAVNLLTAKHLLSAGSEIGDFALKTGSAILMLILTLTADAELRRHIQHDETA